MINEWSATEEQRLIDKYEHKGVNADVALCVYTTRLLGQNSKLVLHGGGNTSVKTRMKDLLGEETQVLCVKGSGWDMATIEPEGLPAVHHRPLVKLRRFHELADEDMVNFERSNLLDSTSPTPSVEALTHAFLPHKFVNHTHSTAILSLTNYPDSEALCREVFEDSMGIVRYIMPGFLLAKEAIEVFEAGTEVRGLVLLKHGIFTFAESAREAYDGMIDAVTMAEERLKAGRRAAFAPASLPRQISPPSVVAPVIRGACSIRDEASPGDYKRFILDFRTNREILTFVNGQEVARYSQQGVATPDHSIRTKNWPLIVAAPERGKMEAFKSAVHNAVSGFVERYHAYFTRHSSRHTQPKTELDPMPRVVLVPGLGLFGLGRQARDARIAADIAESTIETISKSEAIGRYESIPESDMFDVEYWSLEQAKLGKSVEPPLVGQVAVITGGGGTIGSATAAAFSRAGAETAILDIDDAAAEIVKDQIGGNAIAIGCDVTDPEAVRLAFDKVSETFGGVDIVVSNAGAALQGKIGEVSDDVLRRSFELNFFAHQSVAQNAVRVMRSQGTGGVLLFNVSKQAVNPGPNFGPYGLPKAATLFLVRQYAVDHGGEGIRVNAVNADRIRSGLLDRNMIVSRAASRGMSEEEYMSGNLLGREVTAEDVAQAFVHQALQINTTADVTTVDGGNIAGALR